MTVFDIGASGEPQSELLSLASISDIIICEPDKRIQEFTKSSFAKAGFRSIHFIEKFLGGGTESSFYLTKRQECSSLLKPNLKVLSYFPFTERFEEESVLKIETSTIDSLDLKQKVDYLKIDTQGSELEILKNYSQLPNALLIESEVEFLEIYSGQPLYRHMDEHLSKLNFSVIDIKTAKWKLNTKSQNSRDVLVNYCGRNTLSFANVIYINNNYLPWNLTLEKAIKDDVIKVLLLLSRFKQISLAVSILEKALEQKIVNAEEFQILKDECLNFKFKRILTFLLFKNTTQNKSEFDREFI